MTRGSVIPFRSSTVTENVPVNGSVLLARGAGRGRSAGNGRTDSLSSCTQASPGSRSTVPAGMTASARWVGLSLWMSPQRSLEPSVLRASDLNVSPAVWTRYCITGPGVGASGGSLGTSTDGVTAGGETPTGGFTGGEADGAGGEAFSLFSTWIGGNGWLLAGT